jgi:16S rRNA processing protein RimM
MIKIGTIVKPQGVKGEVKIIPEDKIERYLNLKTLFIDAVEKKIISLSGRNEALFVKFENVDDRIAAELLRGKEVFAREEDLEKLQENEFYFKDLIGATVYDENNEKIGELIDIEQYGAADIISIRERNIIFSVPFIEDIFLRIEPQKVIVNREKYDDMKISD